MVLAAGFAPALATLSTSCLCCWTTRAKWMEPPAGAAPARLSYKGSLRAAARRRKWSQSPVLPWAQRAYETRLSAGSIAMENGVPSRTLTSNLEFRTLLLCALSYGDKETNPWLVSSTSSHPALSKALSSNERAGPLDLLRVQGFEMVRASGNAPDPGTHLVRLRL